MACLLDTGVLLRLIDRLDPLHQQVRGAVDRLRSQQESLVIATQNLAEFWSVATRPQSDNGLAMSPTHLLERVEQIIEPMCSILYEREDHYRILKRLLDSHGVLGKQVHDARLVAAMLSWNVRRVLTLNQRHFHRFAREGIEVLSPLL